MADSAPTKEAQDKSSLLARWREVVSVTRDSLLLLLAFLLLVFPTKFNDLMMRAGFEEGSIVGFKWKSKLADSDQALKEARATITDLSAQNEKLSKALADAKKVVTDTVQRRSIDSLQLENKRLNQSTAAVATSTQAVITASAAMVETANLASESGVRWAVVFGGDVSLELARYEVGAQAHGWESQYNASIYLREGRYRAVAVADSREEAKELLSKGKRRRGDSYIVNLERWCPEAVQKPDFVQCDQDTVVAPKS
ncbi:MAG: hypothetical protein IPN71_00080 [Fibrobacteres bacterium]|nr:hypothetical protein [Fibrobacterota bacterium]